jgi:hypothetical protein
MTEGNLERFEDRAIHAEQLFGAALELARTGVSLPESDDGRDKMFEYAVAVLEELSPHLSEVLAIAEREHVALKALRARLKDRGLLDALDAA